MKKQNNSDINNENNNEIREAQTDAVPVIPLPNPGEGGAVYPGNGSNGGNIGNNNNNMNGNMGTFPGVIIGGVGSVPNMPNFIPQNIIGTIISTHPRPNEPCRFCNPNIPRSGNIRFLNAATGYNPFVVFVNENVFSSKLGFGELTGYERVSEGNQIVTVMGDNGYIYIQKPIQVQNNISYTIAIINTDSGMDLEVIEDKKCDRGNSSSCVRAINLAYYSTALSVVIGNQNISFNNLSFKSVSDYEQIWQGEYIYSIIKNSVARFAGFGASVLLTSYLNVQRNRNYTIYILNWQNSSDAIKALVVEEMN